MTPARSLALVLLTACAVLAALLVACGSSKSSAGPNDAATDAVTVDGGGDSGRATTGVGVVTFSELVDSGGTFFAGFSETTPLLATNCTALDAGPCVTTSCTAVAPSDGGSSDASATAAPSAGALTITGGVFGSKGIGPASSNPRLRGALKSLPLLM